MKLAECLNAADVLTLRKIVEYYDFPVSRHSKFAMLQEISFTFRNPRFMEEEVSKWYDACATAMLRLALENRSAFSPEELVGMFGADSAEAALSRATAQGWLYPTSQYSGRTMYFIPSELHAMLKSHVTNLFRSKILADEEGPLTFQEEGHAMVRDLDVLLEYIRHHDVRLTMDGSLYKRNLTQILELLEISEEPLASGWRFGYGRRFHDYPDRLALIYDFAYSQQLIDESDSGVLKTTDACLAWSEQPTLMRQQALVRFYIQVYRKPIVRLPQIVQLLATVAADWVHCDSMLEALNGLVNEYYYDDRSQVWQVRILKMLMHLGIIRLGQHEDAAGWFQITKLGQQLITPDAIPGGQEEAGERNKILIVQPNFDIVVTADQPTITAQLAICAELKQTGVVRVYRITEATVERALVNGESMTEWLQFLQRHAQTTVPGNVERTLIEWARSFEENHGQNVGS